MNMKSCKNTFVIGGTKYHSVTKLELAAGTWLKCTYLCPTPSL